MLNVKLKNNRFNITLIFGTVLIFGIILPGFTYFWFDNRPVRIPVTISPHAYRLTWDNIKLKTTDNRRIAAWFIPAGRQDVGMILTHGYGANREHMLPQAAHLVKNYDIPVLLLDMRGHGDNAGEFFTYGVSEAEDILSAISYLRSRLRSDIRIGAWAFSAGTDAVLNASDKANSSMTFLILESPPLAAIPISFNPRIFLLELMSRTSIMGTDSKRFVKNFTGPILAIAGEQELMYAENARWIQRQNPRNRLLIVPGADHGGCWGPLYKATLQAFFKDLNILS